MNITMTSTDQLTYFNGVAVRVWRGMTERGIPCLVFTHRLVAATPEDLARFEAEVQETLEPGHAVELRTIL
jgi:hypothetical protein